MEMIIYDGKYDANALLAFEKKSLSIINPKLETYTAQMNEIGLEVKVSYFWMNSITRVTTPERIPFERGYTMYIQAYLYKELKKLEVAGGETDDLGYFTEILHIPIQRKKQQDYIYINFEFADFEMRISDILSSINNYGYVCTD